MSGSTTLTYGHGVSAFLSMCLVLLLFTGSFTAVSIPFHAAFAYSSPAVTTNSSINKEIPPQAKSFILNQIVNKSKEQSLWALSIRVALAYSALEICQKRITYP